MSNLPSVSLGIPLKQVVTQSARLRNSLAAPVSLNRADLVGSPVRLSEKSATVADLEKLRQDVTQFLYYLETDVYQKMRQIQAQVDDLAVATQDKLSLLEGKMLLIIDNEKQMATALGQQFQAEVMAQLAQGLTAF
jgi:hypothetical protein